jgi:hypothetical protein
MDVADGLGQSDSGRRPAFPSKFPKKCVVLLHHWKDNHLGEYLEDTQIGWQRALKMAYKKRRDCFLYVKERADADLSTLEAAAEAIDRGKGGSTLDYWLRTKKANDPNVAQRSKRVIDIGVGNRRRAPQVAVAPAPQARTVTRVRARTATRGGGRGGGRGGRGGRGRGGRGRGGRGQRIGRQPNGLPWPAPDGSWRNDLSVVERRRLAEGASIMRGDAGHPGWRNEAGITSNQRDAEDFEATLEQV